MLVSPYTPGDRPKRLAGRSEDLQAIRDYLAPVLAYGEKANAQMILHGPRGVGKTSLMGAGRGRRAAPWLRGCVDVLPTGRTVPG